MTKTIVATLALATGALPVHAQTRARHEFDVLVGSTVATFDAATAVGAGHRAGPLLGVGYRLAGGDRLSFEPELLLAQKGASLAIDPVAGGFDQARYLEAPLLGRLTLTRGRVARPFLVAGPTIGVRLDCTAGRVLGSTPFSESCSRAGAQFRRGEVSGTVGAGVDFGRIQVGGRYELGLTDASGGGQAAVLKNRMLAFTMGVALHR